MSITPFTTTRNIVDTEYRVSTIKTVNETDGGYTLTDAEGWSIFCPAVTPLAPPTAGETLRLYGRGLGYEVRGIAVGDRVFRYQSKAESKAENERQAQVRQQQAEERFVATKDATDQRIQALPAPLRDRILAFQQSGGHTFRRDREGYELFCCEQAVLIADALKTPEAIKVFYDTDWAAQQAQVPGLSDGHSGNTFGAACMLARLLLEQPEAVAQMPGALSPLVGSAAYHTEGA